MSARTIVIADDEPHVLALLRAALRGHELVEASTGAEALAAITEHAPAIAILDGHMPDLDGYEVTRRVRAAAGAQPHILMLTAAGRETDRTAAEEAGVDEFLTKPFSPSALRARIAELLA